MPKDIKQLFLKMIVFFPLSLAVWLFLRDLQSEGVGNLSVRLLDSLFPFAEFSAGIEGEIITFHAVASADYLQDVTGHGAVSDSSTLDPMIMLSGLPLFVALMLSGPDIKRFLKQMLVGTILIFSVALVGSAAHVSGHLLSGLLGMGVDLHRLAGLPRSAPHLATYIELMTVYIAPS